MLRRHRPALLRRPPPPPTPDLRRDIDPPARTKNEDASQDENARGRRFQDHHGSPPGPEAISDRRRRGSVHSLFFRRPAPDRPIARKPLIQLAAISFSPMGGRGPIRMSVTRRDRGDPISRATISAQYKMIETDNSSQMARTMTPSSAPYRPATRARFRR